MFKKACPCCDETIDIFDLKNEFTCSFCGQELSSDIISVLLITLVVVEVIWYLLLFLFSEFNTALELVAQGLFTIIIGFPIIKSMVTISKKNN